MYFWLLNFRCYTVKPVFKGHPRAMAKWPLNTGVVKFNIRVKWEWHFVWHWIILCIFRLKTLARWYEKTVTMKIQTKQKPSGVNVVHLFIQNFTWRVPNRVFLSRNPDPKFRQSLNPKGYFWHPTSRAYFQSRISPRFRFKIPNPELQIREIPQPEKLIGDPLREVFCASDTHSETTCTVLSYVS